MHLRTLAYACVATVASLSTQVVVASPIIFGPKSYTLTEGKPQTFAETFAVGSAARCAGKASFMLVVQNGGGTNGKGISSGSIAVNGQTLIAENDFNANVITIERPVNLADANTLTIKLNGGPTRATITLSIRRIIEERIFGPLSFPGGTSDSRSFVASGLSSTFYVVGQSTANASIRINGLDVVTQADFGRDGSFRKAVALQSTNAIATRVNGNSSAMLTFDIRRELGESACGPTVKILSPAPDAIINDQVVIVTGTVTGSPDVGVTVNRIPGTVQFDAAGSEADPFRWVAAIQPQTGSFVLDAVATAPDGATGEDKRTILFAPDPANVFLTAYPLSGPAPLTVGFRTTPVPDTAQVQIDFDGDGVFDFTGPAPPDPIQFTYDSPGIRVVTYKVTRTDGSVVHGISAITVQSFATMDSLLQRQWTGFADALAAGNVDQALTFLAGDDTRGRYRGPLTLIQPRLAAFASAIREIHPVSITGHLADYLVIRVENSRPHGYHVYFVPDANGVWKIGQF